MCSVHFGTRTFILIVLLDICMSHKTLKLGKKYIFDIFLNAASYCWFTQHKIHTKTLNVKSVIQMFCLGSKKWSKYLKERK